MRSVKGLSPLLRTLPLFQLTLKSVPKMETIITSFTIEANMGDVDYIALITGMF